MIPLKSSIKYFALYVNSLVDAGCFESIEEIERQIANRNIVNFIGNKYRDRVDFSVYGPQGPYSAEDTSKAYENFTGYIEGNESRKFAVRENGLCLIVALSLEIIFNEE